MGLDYEIFVRIVTWMKAQDMEIDFGPMAEIETILSSITRQLTTKVKTDYIG